MKNGPVVEEVRRVRDELARKFDYDIHAIFADVRERQERHDPAHFLVQDARAWVEARENVLSVREEPPKT